MEEKRYSCPTVEILLLGNSDVITTSFPGEDGDDIFDV